MRTAPLLALLVLQAAPQITATVSSGSVAPGEPFELRIRVETDGATPEIRLGALPAGLEIIQTGVEDARQSNFPAGTTRVVTNAYMVVGRVPGSFVLPAATVRVGNREYASRALSVTVRRPGRSADPDLANPPRLTIAAEPKRAWVVQPVVLRADALFPRELRTRLTRPATYEPPAATGFWVIDLPNPMSLQLQRLGGEVYEVQTHRRVYVPIVAGTHTLLPARLDYESRYGLLQPPESRFVLSDTLTIEVLDLPENGRPPAFAGAVGDFTMIAGLEPRTVTAGEAAGVRVEIRGRGNVRAIAPPALRSAPSLEVLPPTETLDEDLTGTDIGGSKTFRWAVIPTEAGRFPLGPIEFAFFHPEAREYRVLRSDSLFLDVTGFAGSEVDQGLRPPDPSPSPPRLRFVRSRAFAFAQAIPLLVFLAAGFRRRRAAVPKPRVEDRPPAERAAIARLRAAAARGEAGVADDLAALLRRAGADRAGSGTEVLAALAEEVDAIRFAPGDDAPRLQELVERAASLLDARARGGHAKRGLIALWLAAAATGVPAQASARTQDGSFRQGLAALNAGEPATARVAFEAYLAREPHDASAWHNLGNAAYRMGDQGAATHAWLQALDRDPRHAAARHNLVTVAGAAASRVLRPRFALGDEGALLALSAVWWLALGAAVLTPRTRRTVIVAAAAAVGLAVGAAWVAGRTAPRLATARADGVVIHAEPALQSEAIRRLGAGEPLVLAGRADAWVRVLALGGEEGWVESSRLWFVSDDVPQLR